MWAHYNRNGTNFAMIRNAYVAGMYPNIGCNTVCGRKEISTALNTTVGTSGTPEGTMAAIKEYCVYCESGERSTPVIEFANIWNGKAKQLVVGTSMMAFLLTPGQLVIGVEGPEGGTADQIDALIDPQIGTNPVLRFKLPSN